MQSRPVQSIFAEAVEITDSGTRRKYLDSVCGGNTALRQEIDELLAADNGADSSHFMLNPAAGACDVKMINEVAAAVSEPPPADAIGTRIGQYTLLKFLGAGGMGNVFLAEQNHPVQRHVALKILKFGLDSREIIARFEGERQALALMDHPNIAKVYDAGTTTSIGRPYFIMELVKGIAVTKYCESKRLPLRERLQLFVQACRAIQHAHQKGIIHRDIKPSNVLVAMQDDKPSVKVIDFGVAKAIGQKLTDETLLTQAGAIIGTLEYMSPEQAGLSAGVDARSDIYSLGVLLYELLTCITPLDHGGTPDVVLVELLHRVREAEAPRPSTIVTSPKLAREIRGDLDWIVMRALEKDRARRYETALDFARDVERHLNDEPVDACPPSAIYRIKKFSKKHRTAVSLSAALIVMLIAGVIVSISLTLRAQNAEAKAVIDRNSAIASAAEEKKAKLVEAHGRKQTERALTLLQEFMVELIPRDGQLDIRSQLIKTMDAMTARLDTEFPNEPSVRAGLRAYAGQTHDLLGNYAKAIPLYEKAIEDYKQSVGEKHADTLRVRASLANAYFNAGQEDKAIALMERTLDTQKSVFGAESEEALCSMMELAFMYSGTGRQEKGIALGEIVAEKSNNAEWRTRAQSDIAFAYLTSGFPEKAIPISEKMIAKCKEAFGPDDPRTAREMTTLARALMNTGRYEEAVVLLSDALEKFKKISGPENVSTLLTMGQLGRAYASMNQLDKALPLLEQSYALQKQLYGAEHANTNEMASSLARAYAASDRIDAAAKLLKDALDIQKAKFGEHHRNTMTASDELSTLYLDTGRLAEALALAQPNLEWQKLAYGEFHLEPLRTRLKIAQATAALGDVKKALPMFESLAKDFNEHLEPDAPDTLNALYSLNQAWFALGEYSRAEAGGREMLDRQHKRFGEKIELSATLELLSTALLAQDKFAEAEIFLRRCVAIRETYTPEAWHTFAARCMLGTCLRGQKKLNDGGWMIQGNFEKLKKRANPANQNEMRFIESMETQLLSFFDESGQTDNAEKLKKARKQ